MKLIVALGLVVAQPVLALQDPDASTNAAKKARQSEAGLAEWLLQERDEAEAESSRSIHQTAPRRTPRPGN